MRMNLFHFQKWFSLADFINGYGIESRGPQR